MRDHIDAFKQAIMVKTELNKVSTSLLEKIVVAELLDHMKAIMKMCSAVSPLNANEKLNHVIKRTVSSWNKKIIATRNTVHVLYVEELLNANTNC